MEVPAEILQKPWAKRIIKKFVVDILQRPEHVTILD
jgi:hypothetical protein